MEITKLHYNWFQSGDRSDWGEDYFIHEIGKKGVAKITQHTPQGEGDRWFYDVEFKDGRTERIFNPNQVFFSPDKPCPL